MWLVVYSTFIMKRACLMMLNLGALGYRAPELATTRKPFPTFKADVYAFGMCDKEGRGTDCFDKDIAGLEEAPRVMDELLAVSLRCILPVNVRPNIRTVFEDLCSITM
ncbi:putative inactive receptor kinase [Cocos nucifera]|uniref:Putative inactive receptor kinase n=1 Tax=Cocos nucifera TaxID=13894 RepID=A0A8K0MX40_COCNU|nr:putative inactive receptor kinase [Cocos nucifera]